MSEAQLQSTAPDRREMERRSREISALARELAPETERERQLADELVARLRESGVMMAGAPREVGCPELAPGLALQFPMVAMFATLLVRVDRRHEQPAGRVLAP